MARLRLVIVRRAVLAYIYICTYYTSLEQEQQLLKKMCLLKGALINPSLWYVAAETNFEASYWKFYKQVDINYPGK